jgi:hypothetical protein
MGLLSHTVGAVVTVVENATGNQGSGAGDWTEQQAANAEDAAQGVVDAVVDGAADPVGFLKVLTQHVESRVGTWLMGGAAKAGIVLPNRLDLASLCGVVLEVVDIAVDRIDSRLDGMLPAPVVGAGRRLVGAGGVLVQRGPAAVWVEIKDELNSANPLGKVRQWGGRLGTRVEDSAPAATVVELARRADDERAKLLIELRLAWAAIKAGVKGSMPERQSFDLQRAFSRGPDGAELRRLCLQLLAAAESGKAAISPEAARHLAAAATAAARGAALHAELLLWLAALRRLAARSRRAKRR